MMMQDSEGADLLRAYNAAMVAKSADALADLYCLDAVHEVPFAHADATTVGREVIRERYRSAWAAAPVKVRGMHDTRLHRSDDGQTWIAEQDLDLTNTDTGAEFIASMVLIFTLRDGRIASMRDYTDNLTIARALGRIPAIA